MDTNKEIYLDNAATTMVDKDAAELAFRVMTENYANPSSVHAKGLDAAHILKTARLRITEALGYEKGDGSLIFTSCGTEASNTAIFGAYELYFKNKDNIVISDSEHPSVENCARLLEKKGVKVFRIPTKNGILDMDYAQNAINDKTALVSCMLVNNETGAVYDLKGLKRIKDKKAPNALLHIDAVQGFLKLESKISCFDADMVTLSAHKIHAPKGVGALYVKKGVRICPRMIGGGQEQALRSGTENLAGIAAFGLAAEKGNKSRERILKKLSDINFAFKENLSRFCPEAVVNSGQDGFAKHIVSISVHGVRSEIMLRYLSDRKIYVSAGSACSSAHSDNRVLKNFGLDEKRADSTLRISFSEYNTELETEMLAKALADGEKSLIKTL